MWVFTTYIQCHTDTQVVAEKKSTQWNSLTFKRQIKLLRPGQNVVGYTTFITAYVVQLKVPI